MDCLSHYQVTSAPAVTPANDNESSSGPSPASPLSGPVNTPVGLGPPTLPKVWHSKATLNAPITSLELSNLDRHVELLLDQIATQDRSTAVTSFDDHIGRQRLRDSATDAMVPESRLGAVGGNWEIGEDTIHGDDGSDLLLGDRVAIVSPLMIDDVGRQVTLSRSAYGIGYLEDAMRSFLDNDALNRVDVDLSGDHIEGGAGDDVMLGSVGEDRLHGDDGDDTLRGGNERDVLIGGTGTNTIRRDGGNYPNVELSDTLGDRRFAATADLTTQLYLDAASGSSMPVNWITSTTTTDSTGGETGDPDTPLPPELRTVVLDPNIDPGAVIGQPVRFSAAITDLPAGAIDRFLWEVTDSAGGIVSVGQGPSFEFTPTQSGSFTVKAIGSDNPAGTGHPGTGQNGLGESSIAIDVQNVRLIADSDQPGKSILVIGGTPGEDDIRLNDVRRSPDSVEVRIKNGGPWSRQTYENISRIDVYAGDGDDDISGDKRLTIPLRLFGGAGNDKLRGSAASDFLSGGAGEDRLLGQDGDDVLIGGLGIDRLDGGDDDDLMISDDLASVYQKTDADSLMNRWAGATTSVADRMIDLITDLSGAISADGAQDSLDGDDGTDWFFAQLSDEIRQRNGAQDVKTLF